jgi:uncharacterized protein (DUF1800 family)
MRRVVWLAVLIAVANGACVAQAKRATGRPKAVVDRPPALTPLNPRERVVQLLDRFTFGPKPGEVDRVLAMGADRWLEQQLNPDAIDDSVLQKRLVQFPTVNMTPAQALTIFPNRGQIDAVGQGKVAMPTDPLVRAVYEVQVAKWNEERDQKKLNAPEMTDEQKAAQKQTEQATAARVAGELLALPKDKRMTALIALPVEDRIAFTRNADLPQEERNVLFGDFSPREREVFQAMSAQVDSAYYIGSELQQARVLRDILSERQLEQVMTDFWFNHFNVFLGKDSDRWYTTSYEREVIRKHALGSFRELLMATATSPAMMVYLDNWQSIGPDSLANGVNPYNLHSKKGKRGLNENYGREVMELHTVGVNGGYTQADVTALSSILTGGTVDKPNEGGGFVYDPNRHEPGPKVWFGYLVGDDGSVKKLEAGERPPRTMPAEDAATLQNSVKQGMAALEILADSPQTARFISTLLAQYFVADTPPPGLVDRLTHVFVESHGDIKAMLRAIAESPEFNSRQYFHTKVKTPEEFVASAFRATGTDPQNLGALTNTTKAMGMDLYYALPPTGYYLTAAQWMNSTALVDRLNFAYRLTHDQLGNQRFDGPRLLATGMLSPGAAVVLDERHGAQPMRASGTTSADARVVKASATESADALEIQSQVGPRVTLEVLEATMIGVPVLQKTNHLVAQQMQQQPANASAADTLNLMTALVLGSPEFQMR